MVKEGVSMKSLQEYDINERTGFLCEGLEENLPERFLPWERLANLIPQLLLAERFKEEVEKLPELVIEEGSLELKEQKRMYSILAMLSSAYIWSNKDDTIAIPRLPSVLAKPLLEVSSLLGLCPVVSHPAVVLFNWKPIYHDLPLDLSNVQTLNLFTGSMDESWFYLVTVGIELDAVPALKSIPSLYSCLHKGDLKGLGDILDTISNSIKNMTNTLLRMKERTSGHVFYHRLRKYLTGSKNCEALPEGLYYGEEETARKFSGGSAAQSSSIQAFDAVFEVVHDGKTTSFLRDMRNYMPRKHRAFLLDIEQQVSLKSFIEQLPGEEGENLRVKFDQCVKELENFRSKHIQIVAQYIVAQSRNPNEKGTGGSSFMQLLKASRDETASRMFSNASSSS